MPEQITISEAAVLQRQDLRTSTAHRVAGGVYLDLPADYAPVRASLEGRGLIVNCRLSAAGLAALDAFEASTEYREAIAAIVRRENGPRQAQIVDLGAALMRSCRR